MEQRLLDARRITLLEHDLAEPLPALRSFDVVVSSFAIHHLVARWPSLAMTALAASRLCGMLHHVALEIRPEQIQDCADFYRLLGFEEVTPPETIADRAAWVEREGTQVHLLKTDEPTVLPSGHLAVVAEDYAATISALEQAGHRPDQRSRHWGAPRAFVKDPAGNLVEIMAWRPRPRPVAGPSVRSAGDLEKSPDPALPE